MNKYQRVVLILGAITFVIAEWTTPKVYLIGDKRFMVNPTIEQRLLPEIDLSSALVRGFTVIGVTFLLFFAFKSNKSKELGN